MECLCLLVGTWRFSVSVSHKQINRPFPVSVFGGLDMYICMCFK